MLKHYRKKGTKEITHRSLEQSEAYHFWEDKIDGVIENFETQKDLNKYLEENDLEEVINEPKEDMTKLMPVLGKRYKEKLTSRIIKLDVGRGDDSDCVYFTVGNSTALYKTRIVGDKTFWDYFEELPEEPTNAKNAQVEEAREELRKLFYEMIESGGFDRPAKIIENLLNALDEQDKPEKDK